MVKILRRAYLIIPLLFNHKRDILRMKSEHEYYIEQKFQNLIILILVERHHDYKEGKYSYHIEQASPWIHLKVEDYKYI